MLTYRLTGTTEQTARSATNTTILAPRPNRGQGESSPTTVRARSRGPLLTWKLRVRTQLGPNLDAGPFGKARPAFLVLAVLQSSS